MTAVRTAYQNADICGTLGIISPVFAFAIGGGDARIFLQLLLVGFQRDGAQRLVFIHRFQTLIGQQVVFQELFRQLFVRAGGVDALRSARPRTV